MGNWMCQTMNASIGKKALMAISGLVWSGFLIGHLLGNFLLFKGEDAFMAYANLLSSNKNLLYVAEAVLAIFLFLHVYNAFKVSTENLAARPKGYFFNKPAMGSSFASRSMIHTGMLILIFIILHLWTIKFGMEPDENLYHCVIRRLSNVPYALFYIFSAIMLGIHVSHGLQSATQTLGLYHQKYTPTIKKVSLAFGLFVAAGYSAIALYFMIGGGLS